MQHLEILWSYKTAIDKDQFGLQIIPMQTQTKLT